MSEEESKKPKLERIRLARERLESMYEVDLCSPIKRKLPKDVKICGPNIEIKPCEPLEKEKAPLEASLDIQCAPNSTLYMICKPDLICTPDLHSPCFPDKFCKPNILCVPHCEPGSGCKPISIYEVQIDRLDEIAENVKSLKSEVAEIKKRVGQK